MGARIGLDSFIKGIKDQCIIIRIPEYIGRYTPVKKVQNGTEVELMYFNTLIPLELGHIRQPFLVGPFRCELPFQQVLCDILGARSLSGAAIIGVLNGGFDTQNTADAQNTFVVHCYLVIVF